jgi:TP901 family phage tail tape measure protein
MADVQSNIHVNIDTSEALASIKALQRQISAFHTSMAKSGAAAAAVSANMQQNLINSLNASGKWSASMRNVKTTTESFTNALEKNKLSMRDYYRYSMGATKTFGKFFKSEFDTVNKVARERVKDLQTQYVKLGRDANGAMKAIAVRPLALDMKNLGTQTAIASQRQALLNQLLKQGATNMLNFGKNTQWAGRQLMVGFTVPLAYLGTAAAKTFMKLEEQAIRFKRVYGEMFTTGEETDKMLKEIQLLAKEFTRYGVSVEKTMEMAASAAASGKLGADLLAQVNEATRLAVLGGVEQEQALETTISLTNAFGLASEDLAKKINFLNAVENQTVVSIEDLTIAIPKAGPVVQQLGGDVEDLAFFLTAMKEGGINASEGANALKSGLASLINPTEKASKMLGEMGVNITGIVEANKGNVKGVVVDFANALNTLDPLNRARAIEQLFGKFQFSRLSTLFQNVIAEGNQASRVLTLTKATTEELAILSERELARVEESTTYKFKKTIEDLKVTLAPVGEQFLKAITPIVEFVSKILEKFNNLGDGTKKFVIILTTLLGGIGPVLLMTFGLLANGLANIIKLFVSMKSVFNRAGQSSTVLGNQTQFLTAEQAQATAVAASLEQVHVKLQQTFTSEVAALNALTQAYQRAIAAQRGFGGPIVGKGRKGFADGTKKVKPFYFARGTDTVPAMLTPGEAVIPAGPAQDPRNKPAIAHMISGGTMSMFSVGTKGAGDFSHIGTPRTVGALDLVNKLKALPAGIISARAMQAIEAVAMKFANTLKINLYGKLGITTGMSNVDGRQVSMNNLMKPGGRGVGKGEFMADWDKRGLNRWKISLRNGGMKMQDVAADLAILDTHMKDYLTSLDANTRITDTHVKEAYDYGRRKMGAENRLVRAFDQLAVTAGEARINISQAAQKMAGLPTAPGGGSKGAVDVNGMKIRRGGDRFTFYKRTGFSLVDFAEKSMAEGMRERAQVASPSRVTKKIGADIAAGAVIGMKEYVDDARVAGQQIGGAVAQGAMSQAQKAAASRSALYGTGPIDPAQKSLRRQLERQARLKALAEKKLVTQSQVTGMVAAGASGNAGNKAKGGLLGRLRRPTAQDPDGDGVPNRGMGAGGAMMAASAITMGASMMPGAIGDMAQKIMMPLMALTMVLPLLQSKLGLFAVGIGLVIAAAVRLRMAFDKAQDSAMKLALATGSGQDAIRSMAKFAGGVTAGEVMDRRREAAVNPFSIQTGKTTFGESFVASQEGKDLVKATGQNIQGMGRAGAQGRMVNQLATAVSSGAMTAAQARSVAANIGKELGDYSFGIQVNAKLIELIGVNGENLLKDPLAVRVKLIEETRKNVQSFGDQAKSAGAWTGKDMLKVGAGGTVGGALAGAATGAIIGSVVPVIGTALGAGVGAVAGSIAGNLFSRKDRAERIGTASGASIAMQKMALEQQQEMVDSLDIAYEKRIAEAQAAGDLAKVDELTNKHLKDRSALLEQNGKLLKDIATSYSTAEGATRKALDTGADKAITNKYKGTAMEDVAKLAKQNLNDNQNLTGEQRYLLKMELASGEIDPMQMINLLESFGNDKESITKVMNIITKFGGAFGNQIMSTASLFVDKDGNPVKSVQTKFIAKIESAGNAEEAERLRSFYAMVAKTGNVLNTSIITEFLLKNPEVADRLMKQTEQIEALKGKIDFTVASKVLNADQLKILNDDLDYFNSIKTDELKKVYLQTLVQTITTVSPDDPALQSWLSAEGSAYKNSPPGTQLQEYAQWNAQRVTVTAADTTTGPTKTPSSGGGTKQTSVLDELVKKLRDVRKNQIKVTEGWSASMKTLDQLFGGKKRIEIFSGIEQDLTKLGAKGNFIELIVGMDPKEYEKRKNQLFKFDNKGNIVGLKRDAKTVQEALNAIVAGDYASQMKRQEKDLEDQAKAYNILRGAGLGFADTQELIADKAFAAMIASEGNTKAAKNLIELLKKVKSKSATAQATMDIRADFDASELEKKAKENLAKVAKDKNWSWLEADAILSDETLRDAMGKWDKLTKEQKEVFQKRLQQVLNSIEFKESIFQKGFDKAMEKFSVMETKIELDFQFTTLKDQDIIEKAQDKIAGINYEIDDWEASLKGIEDQEEKINEKYDAKFKALDEIRAINERISKQQKGQLTIADALSQGDISAAARAAQDLRAEQANQALDDQQKLLEAAKENELAQVRNDKGYTRAQIEDQIKKLRAEIFKIEEEELEPAQERVRIEEAKKRELIQSLTVLGKSKLEWEEIKNRIDLARTSSAEYMQAIQAALDVVEDIVNYWLSLDGKIITTTHKIITIYENGGSTGGNNGGNNGGDDGGDNDGTTDDVIVDTGECPPGMIKADDGRCIGDFRGINDGDDGTNTNNNNNNNNNNSNNQGGDNNTGTAPNGRINGVVLPSGVVPTNVLNHLNDLGNIQNNIAKNSADFAAKIQASKIADEAGQVAASHYMDLYNLGKAVNDANATRVTEMQKDMQKAEANLKNTKPVLSNSQKASVSNAAKSSTTGASHLADLLAQENKAKAAKAAAEAKRQAEIKAGKALQNSILGSMGFNRARGGIIPKRYALGGRVLGTDTVPAMLTPGEFIMSRHAVQSYGIDRMKAINNGEYPDASVYNYSIAVNVRSDANPDEIARAVMTQIRQVDSKRLRGRAG